MMINRNWIVSLVSMIILIDLPNSYGQKILHPESTADYGSGASACSYIYYPGGVPGIGLYLGQPNTSARSDRVLVRFNLAEYLLLPYGSNKVEEAVLVFRFEYATGGVPREAEIEHLTYEPSVFSGKDLINSDTKRVGVVRVKQAGAEVYSLNVTRLVNEDIFCGNLYASFRFRDIRAESPGNTMGSVAGLVLAGPQANLPILKIKERK